MKNHRNQAALSTGFTLTELLVVIAIIAVLALLGFMGISSLTKRANAAKDTSAMRQIWTGITMYAGDNNDYMPGPLFARQNSIYNTAPKTNYREWRRLSDCLATYLGSTDPQKGDFIQAMAPAWQKSAEMGNTPAYYMQQMLLIGDGPEIKNPWGAPAPASYDDRLPMKMSAVMAQPAAQRTWMMTQFDQLHPEVTDAALKTGTPEGMVHGSFRLALYFDGRVGKVNQENKPLD